MRKMFKIGILPLLALALWAIGILLSVRAFPFGLAFGVDEKADVSCTVMRSGKAEVVSRALEGGKASFAIPVDADHFFFSFQNGPQRLRLKAMTICGMPLLPAHWIMQNIAPRDWLYRSMPLKPGEPIALDISEEHHELDYVRFFDLVPKLFRIARLGIAFAPLLFFLVYWAVKHLVAAAPRLDRPLVFGCLLIMAWVFSFPNPVEVSSPGLDSSWSWMLNHLAWTRSMGRDVVFTYGPIGFLLVPQASLATAIAALAAHVIFSCTGAWLLWRLYRSGCQGRTSSWLLLMTVLIPQMNNEWRWSIVAILCAAIPALIREPGMARVARIVSFAAAGVLVAIMGLAKFSALIAVFGTQAICVFYAVLTGKGKSRWFPFVAFFAALACVASVLGALCFESPSAFIAWVRGSIATASGYNLYGGIRNWPDLIFSCTVPVVGLFLCLKRGYVRYGVRMMLLFSPLLFSTFKYSVVRQTVCPMMYAFAIAMSLLAIDVREVGRRAVLWVCGSWVVYQALFAPYSIAIDGMTQFQLGVNPFGLVRTIRLSGEIDSARALTETKVLERDIPRAWRDKIDEGRVLFVPVEMGPAMTRRTKFQIVPLPAMQMYSACHPYLDALNAQLLDGENAPEWVVYEPEAGALMNYPCFWDALKRNYEIDDEGGGYVLLRLKLKREHPAAFAKDEALKFPAGEWIDIGRLGGTKVSIEWPLTLWGRFCESFLRCSTCFVMARFENGEEARYIFLPDNTKDGVIDLPAGVAPSHADVVALLKGEVSNRVVAVKFEASSPSHYAKTVTFFKRGRHDRIEEW
ncbi:MAG: hypothetical protein IJ658_13570 [Kiritimatiellae bacterium]|nr:hypothetical protein [Kiritimatiellia bacterium]